MQRGIRILPGISAKATRLLARDMIFLFLSLRACVRATVYMWYMQADLTGDKWIAHGKFGHQWYSRTISAAQCHIRHDLGGSTSWTGRVRKCVSAAHTPPQYALLACSRILRFLPFSAGHAFRLAGHAFRRAESLACSR